MKLLIRAAALIAAMAAAVFMLAGGLGIVMAFAGGTPTFAAQLHLVPNRARLIQGQTILPPDSYEPQGVTLNRSSVSLARETMTLVAYVHIESGGAIEIHGPTRGSAWANVWLTRNGPTPKTSPVAAAVIFAGPECHAPNGLPGTQHRLIPAGWYFATLSYSDAGGGMYGPQTGVPLSITQNGRPLVPYWPAGR